MNFFRKVLFIFFLLSFCFFSCRKKKSEDGVINITFWHSSSDEAFEFVEKYVRRFNEENKGKIYVKAIFQGQYTDAGAILRTVLSSPSSSQIPDIMQIDATSKILYAQSKYAVDISSLSREYGISLKDDYFESALNNWLYDDVQIALPFATSSIILYYNKDLLKLSGFNRVPESLSDIVEIGQLFDRSNIDCAVYGSSVNTPLLSNYLSQLGSYLFDKENGTRGVAMHLDCIDNNALFEFLQTWKDLYKSGYLLNRDFRTDDFIKGRVALLTYSSSSLRKIERKVDGSFDVGVSHFLKINNSSSPLASPSGSALALFDKKDDKKLQAAFSFARFLTSSEIQSDFAIGTGYTPSNKMALQDEKYSQFIEDNPEFLQALKQNEESVSSRSVTVNNAADIYFAIIDETSKMLEKDLSAEECTDNLKRRLENILKR